MFRTTLFEVTAKATLLNRSDKNMEKQQKRGFENCKLNLFNMQKSSILLPLLERKLFSASVGVIVCAKM